MKTSLLTVFILALLWPGPASADDPPDAFFPLASPADAWKALPPLEKGTPGRLPRWALATARALPRTTAAVLELEHRHRANSPLPPVLRGQIRLITAHANGCGSTRSQAAADLRAVGLTDGQVAALVADDAKLSPVLEFARKLTMAAYTVTDAELAEVLKEFGEKQTVAIVQLVAFGNFQDRLVLALGVADEPDGVLPPLAYVFAKDAKPMPRPDWPTAGVGEPSKVDDAEWSGFSFLDLKKKMETQKARPARIAVPSWEDVKKGLPPEAQKRKLDIKWSLVCLGYQPELAQGWSACTRAFGTESALDRVFEESLFWVVTRSLLCFY